jgi:putative membrane protein
MALSALTSKASRICYIRCKIIRSRVLLKLTEISTGINLIVAFSVALKHKLRWEPYTMYDDIEGLVSHLDTFAKDATAANPALPKKQNALKAVGTYLGVSFAESNPMKILKKSEKPTGNLPLEILSYLASYVDDLVENGQLKVPMQQTLAYNNIASLNDALTGTDRILHTPLPIAYSIAISQITWVYIIMLPFQLDQTLKWIMIPATVIAAYIILGILMIGREIENPFGDDVNDLPLDAYCQQIAQDLDIICSRKKAKIADLVSSENNKLLFPLSNLGYGAWATRSERVIREELKYKTTASFNARRRAGSKAEETIYEQPIQKADAV